MRARPCSVEDIDCALDYLRADRDQRLEHTDGHRERLGRVIELLVRERQRRCGNAARVAKFRSGKN